MYPSRLLAMVVSAVALPVCGLAASLGWLNDLQQAKAKSAAERKPLLIEFTGSTGCSDCQALTAQVLSTSEFAAFARDVVLVSLDYPAFDERTPEKVRANPNSSRLITIKEDYQVSRFPTLIFVDPNGTQRAKIEGYSRESAASFIAKLTGVTAQVRSEPSAGTGSTIRPQPRGLLPPDQVTALEDKLRSYPQDSIARQQLLTHYMREQFRSPEARQARQRHVLWLIENQPKAQLRAPEFTLHPTIDGPAYEAGKLLWLKQLQSAPDDVELLERAANYLLLNDRAMAEELLRKAETLDPTNAQWPERLAHLYGLSISTRDGIDRNAAKQALDAMQRAQRTSTGDGLTQLINLAKFAYAAGETALARKYAEQILEVAPQHDGQWNYGNAVHDGNAILGRIALQEGEREKAKAYLLSAGRTPGSPQLNSFGPGMSLASELLQKGESETVLRYLELCRSFWKMGAERLDRWTDAIRNGTAPDFAANLRY